MLGVLSTMLCFVYLHGMRCPSLPFPSLSTISAHSSHFPPVIDAATLILRDAVEPSLIGHAVIVIFYALILTWFMTPTSMGSRRLWACAAVTVLAHTASVVLLIVQHFKDEKNRPTGRSSEALAALVWSVNWTGIRKSTSQSKCMTDSLIRSVLCRYTCIHIRLSPPHLSTLHLSTSPIPQHLAHNT